MEASLLLPLSDGLVIERMSREEQQVIISVRSTVPLAHCPLCTAASEEIISRDRASDYATAATVGAPQARQICDRWHLLRNLSEYVTTFLARMRAEIRKASQEQAPPKEENPLEEARWKEREASEQAQKHKPHDDRLVGYARRFESKPELRAKQNVWTSINKCSNFRARDSLHMRLLPVWASQPERCASGLPME